MKEEIEKTYRGIVGWIRYVKDYKENIENDLISERRLITANNIIRKQKRQIEALKNTEKEKDNSLTLKEKELKEIKEKNNALKKQINEEYEIIWNLHEQINKINDKLKEKEHLRRVSAGAIGGYKAKINDLKRDLAKASYTINFYKTHQKSPTLEEIKAYDLQMKEVEKRSKQ